jgi:hypothetical protein
MKEALLSDIITLRPPVSPTHKSRSWMAFRGVHQWNKDNYILVLTNHIRFEMPFGRRHDLG